MRAGISQRRREDLEWCGAVPSQATREPSCTATQNLISAPGGSRLGLWYVTLVYERDVPFSALTLHRFRKEWRIHSCCLTPTFQKEHRQRWERTFTLDVCEPRIESVISFLRSHKQKLLQVISLWEISAPTVTTVISQKLRFWSIIYFESDLCFVWRLLWYRVGDRLLMSFFFADRTFWDCFLAKIVLWRRVIFSASYYVIQMSGCAVNFSRFAKNNSLWSLSLIQLAPSLSSLDLQVSFHFPLHFTRSWD